MSEENKNIDQLFSDAAHNQKAPVYNTAYWAEMNALLNARGARKRRLLIRTSMGAVFSLFLLTILYVINTRNSDIRVQYAQTQLKLESNKMNSGYDRLNTPLELRNIKQPKNVNSLIVDENLPNQVISTRNEMIGKAETKAHHKDIEHKRNISQDATSQRKDMLNAKEQGSIDKGAYSESLLENSQYKTTSSTTINNSKSRNTINEKENIALELSNDIDENVASIETPIDKNSKESNRMEPSNTAIDRGNTQSDVPSLPIKSGGQLSPSTLEDLITTKVKRTSKTQFSLYAKLSGGLMENYRTARLYQSGLVDLSLNFEARFNSILLRTGIGTQYTTHADMVVSQRAKIYGFGLRNQQNDLSYQNLLDIYIPLEFGYQIRSTSFGIGVQGNYLLTTKMDLNTYQDQVLTNTETYHGHKDGLRPFSTQGYVWLEQRIFSRFSMGLKIGTNISGRIKDGKYFNQSATINPIYGQLSFRFNILQ